MGAWSNGIIFDHLEWPLTLVSRSRYTYKSISQNGQSYYRTLIGTISNISNGIMFGDFDWPLNALRVSISWASCLNILQTVSIPGKIYGFPDSRSSSVHCWNNPRKLLIFPVPQTIAQRLYRNPRSILWTIDSHTRTNRRPDRITFSLVESNNR